MDQRILYKLTADADCITADILKKIFVELGPCFKPTSMKCQSLTKLKFVRFQKKAFYDALSKELEEERVCIHVDDRKNMIDILKPIRSRNVINFMFLIYPSMVPQLDSIFEWLMPECGIVASKCSSEDNFWQNTEQIETYKDHQRDMSGIHTKRRDFWLHDEIIDIEYNPGHSHIVQGIWFGAAYRMWFGKPYYEFIEKKKLMNFQECYEKTILSNDVIRITLWSDMWDFDKEENRAIQLKFRQYVGMDEAAQQLSEMI